MIPWHGSMVDRKAPSDKTSLSKPIIGLAGGIGSGKSTVAGMMGQLGGFVIDADALAREAMRLPEVREELVRWWGPGVLDEGGEIDRRAVADRVFNHPDQRQRLEALIHPKVAAQRRSLMQQAQADPGVRFIVQDVPLLFEAGLDKECDYTLFVEADRDVRMARLAQRRGWGPAELERREKNQWPLDRKKRAADAIIINNGDPTQCLSQVRWVLDRFLSDIETKARPDR